MINYYLVGGYVRDALMGQKSKDIDFAVEAPSYEEMRDDLIKHDITIWQERPEYYAIRASNPHYGAADYVLCRKDGFYSDSRHPDTVTIGTIHDDLSRRDFTVNALAMHYQGIDPTSSMIGGEIIDPYNGQKDIENRVLRCVGDAETRFNEDPLRLLRAIRFHIVKGFFLDKEIITSLKDMETVVKLANVSKERIYEELKKCFEHNSFKTLMFLRQLEALEMFIFGFLEINLIPTLQPQHESKTPNLYQLKPQ